MMCSILKNVAPDGYIKHSIEICFFKKCLENYVAKILNIHKNNQIQKCLSLYLTIYQLFQKNIIYYKHTHIYNLYR